MLKHESTILVTCARGVQPYLAEEIRALGLPVQDEGPAGVRTSGTMADCMRLNMSVRTGHRVLFQLRRFRATHPDHLYNEVLGLAWEDVVPADGYMTVVSSVNTDAVRDSRFVNQRVKDAVVDRINERVGSRPNSGPARTGAVLSIHWLRDMVTLYVDTTGEPLSMRGYRKQPHAAPMRETLCAAVLMAAGYDGTGHLLNPMCGSGTLALEAALMARNIAPCLLRARYAFQQVLGYDDVLYQEIVEQAQSKKQDKCPVRIIATDNDPKAVDAAQGNAEAAGLVDDVEFAVCDFQETEIPEPLAGKMNFVVLNPEYGKRMGDEEELVPVYKGIGDFFKQQCGGWLGGVFTGNRELGKRVGLKPKRRHEFFNGPLDCRLFTYELYAGSKTKREE